MSETNNNNDKSPETIELETLRSLRDELLQTKHTQKARIAELESTVLQLTEARDNAEEKVRAVVVDRPVRAMAAELNPNVPEIVLAELNKDFIFDAAEDGGIVIKHKTDGKPVMGKDSKTPLAFTWKAIAEHLTGAGNKEKTDRQRMYAHIVRVSKASGGGASGPTSIVFGKEAQPPTKDSAPRFGIR